MLTVILTGGASRRMGRDKAALPWGESTFLQSLIDKYAALGPVAVSVDTPGRFAFTGAAELADAFPGRGPLNGLVSGFSRTGAEEIFLTGADLPLGEPELARRLALLRGGADACVLRRGAKGVEPLFAVYGRGCLAAARAALEAGERSFLRMLRGVFVRYAAPEEVPGFDLERILLNVNTPEDYEKLITDERGRI